ncbi:hypothetical protein LTR37_008943 [Vermiconidia calcicola]|uniref:Uncharacterized protein n=1 Tax=Vermiconidia calcicola TaxID=1690605 RepID=A0ACC3N9K2_9PEZI|nr:hypothetical protein LTR37_008943 [Vermiconidia calcicola]
MRYLSASLGQRQFRAGLSMDMFTHAIIGSFRTRIGIDPVGDGIPRMIVSCRNTTQASPWTKEAVIATTCIRGNSIIVAKAKRKFRGLMNVIEPLTIHDA